MYPFECGSGLTRSRWIRALGGAKVDKGTEVCQLTLAH